jgi:hypothetical protein
MLSSSKPVSDSMRSAGRWSERNAVVPVIRAEPSQVAAQLPAIAADLAPPHLLGRYMSLYGLTFAAGVALGPAVGGPLFATSPDAVWWGDALAAALRSRLAATRQPDNRPALAGAMP